jgi:lipopolysaccharide cholinephosphotransferase
MKEYDDRTLKKLQSAELEILRDFVDLCEKNHLVYFGTGGTGIGAIRHGGFIPWDDDIDVAMPREDFEKFVQIAKKEYSEKYIVMNGNENENYPLLTTRWIMKGTEFVEETFKNLDCPLGIFLDIYPFDKIPDDEKLFKKQARQAFFYSKLLILRSIPFPVLRFKGWKAKVVHAICGIIHVMMCILHISKRKLYQKCLKVTTQYNYLEKTKRIDFLCNTTPYLNIYEIKDVYPLKQIEFEGIMMNFPNKIEKQLQREYGNFMELPPVEKRKNHYPYKLKFKE